MVTYILEWDPIDMQRKLKHPVACIANNIIECTPNLIKRLLLKPLKSSNH